MRTSKKLLSLFLSAVLCLSLLPMGVLATENTYVAKIGGTEYETLQAAFDAANDGDTVTLLANVDVGTSYLNITKGITLDFDEYNVTGSRTSYPVVCLRVDAAGKTVTFTGTTGGIQPATGTGCVCVKNGNLVIDSGTYTTTNAAVVTDDTGTKSLTVNGGKLTANRSSGYGRLIAGFAGNITINGGEFYFENTDQANYMYLIEMEGDGSSCTINGGTITADGVGLQGTYGLSKAYTYVVTSSNAIIVNVNGGNVINAAANGSYVRLVEASKANVTIKDINYQSKASAYGCIANCASLTISGGTFDMTPTYLGYGFVITGQNGPEKISTIQGKISGGLYSFHPGAFYRGSKLEKNYDEVLASGCSAYALKDGFYAVCETGSIVTDTDGLIVSGTVAFDPTGFVADGSDAAYNSETKTWTVEKNVAQIGNQKYTTLQAAVDATKSMESATITLLGDVEVTPSHTASNDYGALHLGDGYCCRGLTIDGNGHTLKLANNTFTTNKYNTVSISNGTVTFKNLTVDANAGGTTQITEKSKSAFNCINSTVDFENVTVKNTNGGWSAFNVNKSTVTLINCTAKDGVKQVISCDAGTAESLSKATIKSGTYDGTLRTEGKDANNQLYIEGGSFSFTNVNEELKIDKADGSILEITGGTFSTDPSDYVASGYAVTDNDNDTYTVYRPSSGGGSSTTKTETTTNADGSKTTTTTDTKTGAVTETTTKTETAANGTKTETKVEVVTQKDGTVTEKQTETATAKNGTTATKVETTDAAGKTETKVEAKVTAAAVTEAKTADKPVTIPVTVESTKSAETAATVSVSVPKSAGSTKVEVPVTNVTAGTVAVLVKADGTEEIIKTSVLTEDGVALKVEGDVQIKIIDNTKEFTDVVDNHWAGDAIDFATSHEIFNGTGDKSFAPEATMTRAMLFTVLARFDDAPVVTTGENWYAGSMEWAKTNGVSDGTNPEASISREQLATMLYRYAGAPAVTGDLSAYGDAATVSDYAAAAMQWAVSVGLINGIGGNLEPQGFATRAQLAAIMQRFCTNVAF